MHWQLQQSNWPHSHTYYSIQILAFCIFFSLLFSLVWCWPTNIQRKWLSWKSIWYTYFCRNDSKPLLILNLKWYSNDSTKSIHFWCYCELVLIRFLMRTIPFVWRWKQKKRISFTYLCHQEHVHTVSNSSGSMAAIRTNKPMSDGICNHTKRIKNKSIALTILYKR